VSDSRTDALARSRAAALAELRAAPVAKSWRAEAARVATAFALTGLVAAIAAVAASLAGWDRVVARAAYLAALVALGGLAGVAALAPRLGAARAAVLAATPVLMAGLAISRGAGTPSTTPEWVCSVSHVALGSIPLAFALTSLRHQAWRWSRALVAGLGAGTAGALLGELACRQGTRHVLIHHVGAWVFIGAACVLLSRRIRPRTFAP
jgi:hypothetical protein